jgi:hypothetical protein
MFLPSLFPKKQNPKSSMKKTLALTLMLTSLAASTQAGSILSDDFIYPDGSIVGAVGSPWTQNTGNAGTMTVTNNQLFVAGTSTRSEDIVAPLAGGPYKTNGTVAALYSSFTLNCVAEPSTTVGTYLAHFTAEGSLSTFRARIWISLTNATVGGLADPGTFFLGIGNTTPSGASAMGPASGQWPTALSTGVTYTVVTRYVLATGISTLWINPVAESSVGAVANDTATLANIAYYAFRQATGQGANWIDSLRVGTAFSDVAGADTAPTISSIPNQSIPRNGTTGPQPFTVGDAESPAASLTVASASTNLTLVPVSGIAINDGNGTNRTVTVTPASGQQGTSLVTLTVSDGANTAQTSFRVTVGAPTISFIPNQIAYSNTPIPAIAFTVVDAEGDTLTPTASSSNPTVLQNANVVISGTGSSRTVTLTPEPNVTGVTTVTLSFNDGINTATRSFYVSISPRLGLLLADQFQYKEWNFSPQSIYDAVGSPWQTVSGTAYEVQTTNGWAYLSANLTEDVSTPLTNSPGVFPNYTNYAVSLAVVFYSSFTLKVTDVTLAGGDYFVHLKNSYNGSNFRAKVFVTTNGAAPGSYRIGIANQSNVGTYLPMDCTVGKDYLVVTRYNSGIGEATLWVNPITESSPYVVGTDALQTTAIGAYGLRQSTIPGMGTLQISNLVVSTSFPFVPVPPTITITGISVSGGTVTVTFDAGASDVPANLNLVGATVVNGPYTPTGATVTSPSAGKFQATVATSGATQFYRVKRN